MLDQVLRIAADVFDVPAGELRPESSPDTIPNWDSLHHLNLVLALEQEFAVEFSPEEIEQLLSVELAAALVEEKLKACGVM